MCGITGIYAFSEQARSRHRFIDAATDCLESRGPDSRGTVINGHFALGHRRLSIIDLSEMASQPLEEESGRFGIVYNGEIYNFQELRKRLVDKGHQFKSESDTEVIVKLYMEYGSECLNMLNGFFAFAIYDKSEQKLFLARDRMGIKPLYYMSDAEQFIFGSELRALLAYQIDPELDVVSLYQYLQLNYVPGEHAMVKGIKRLPPGHFAKIGPASFEIGQYYDLRKIGQNRIAPRLADYGALQERLRVLLDESVRKRLIADVPLGAFLSGGIDSSIIVALAARHSKDIRTFSIGFKDEPFYDETNYAQLVADKFKTNHTVFSLSNDDLFQDLFNVLDTIDEPFGDSSAIAVYILSKYTRQNVTVALSGDGADELFAGYNKHQAEFIMRDSPLATSVIKRMNWAWNRLPKTRANYVGNRIRQFARFAEGAGLNRSERYWLWCSFMNEDDAFRLLSMDYRSKLTHHEYYARKGGHLRFFNGKADLQEVLYSDIHLVLPNDMLVKVDKMSMANSLEVRVPFLDHQLVEFALSIPTEFKIDRKMKKRILQDAFRDQLPTELYGRPKRGFEVPLLKWFRKELRSLIADDLLDEDFIREQRIFNPARIKSMKNKLFSSDPDDIHWQIWGLISFQYWWKKYMIP